MAAGAEGTRQVAPHAGVIVAMNRAKKAAQKIKNQERTTKATAAVVKSLPELDQAGAGQLKEHKAEHQGEHQTEHKATETPKAGSSGAMEGDSTEILEGDSTETLEGDSTETLERGPAEAEALEDGS